MSEISQHRIEAMFRRDCIFAWAFVVGLWCTIGYVFIATWPLVTNTGVHIAMVGGASLLLIFNTASIGAMVKHYMEDKEHIYGLDIQHLDAKRALEASLQPAE